MELLDTHKHMKQVFFLLLSLLMHQSIHASGFQVREQSVVGQGASFAGVTAGSSDVNTIFFNGASMMLQNGNAISGTTSLINSSGDFRSGSASTSNGIPIAGFGDYKNMTSNIPSLAFVYSLSENSRLGISVNAPWGLETDYDRTWIGRYHAVKSDLNSINVNPMIAFKPYDKISLSVGVQAQYLDATISNAIDFGTIGMVNLIPGSNPGSLGQDGFVSVDGDDWGFGWTAGVLVELTERTRFGMSFRSKISHKLRGNSNFSLDNQGIGAIISAATGAFSDTDASIRIETPELFNLGIRHDISGKWSVMAEMDYTRWSRLDELDVRFSNSNQNKSVTTLEWNDTWFGSLGVEYRPSDRWQIRGGIAYEEGATASNYRTPRVPDDDRVWLSIGGTYSYNDYIQLHAAFTHIIVEDPQLDLKADFPLSTSDENALRGNLSGEFDLDINILAIGITIEL